jgi:hypothetical protein
MNGGNVTFTDLSRLKQLTNLITNTQYTFTSENVNQILADVWANRDEAKPGAMNREIRVSGSASSGAPTGQGIIDKENLQKYRSPNQLPSRYVWTITTK